MAKTLNPKNVDVTDSATEIIAASAARHEIIISNSISGSTVFISFEADPIVDKGVPLFAGEKMSFAGKHAQMKISGICDTLGTATVLIQEI